MILKIEITGTNMVVDEKLHTYIWKKIGSLDKFVSRQVRLGIHAEVRAIKMDDASTKRYGIEIKLYLPNDVVDVSENSTNVYSAVDIVEAKLKKYIFAYKRSQTAASRKT